MRIKAGVSIKGIQPEIAFVIPIIERIIDGHGAELVITAGTDGKHMTNSLHYKGLAIDIRSRDIPHFAIEDCVANLEESLGEEFDVVIEKDHIHVEYQPKVKE